MVLLFVEEARMEEQAKSAFGLELFVMAEIVISSVILLNQKTSIVILIAVE
jgi:hypothetical protein